MTKEDDLTWDDLSIVKLPEVSRVLKKTTEEDWLREWIEIKHKLDYFKYSDPEMNDVREGYEQFMDDADKFLDAFRELVVDIVEAIKYHKNIIAHAKAIIKAAKKQEKANATYIASLMERGIDPLEPLHSVDVVEEQVSNRAAELQRRKEQLDKVEEEIAITEEVLAKKKSEMELALQSRYTLTEKQKQCLLDEKDKILDGVENWGSISGALAHDHTIQSKASTIMMYCQKFPEFGQAIAVSKQLFKDKLEGIMVERAIEGTENPQFGRGEYIGDYKIKDNKLLVELMKAKVPEVYNKKQVETVKNTQVNNMNIISFANLDEEKEGYTRNVGVVLDVDENGKVKRVMQEQKMIEYYSNKDGAEIILPEEENDDESMPEESN
jgi:hypothetical protein